MLEKMLEKKCGKHTFCGTEKLSEFYLESFFEHGRMSLNGWLAPSVIPEAFLRREDFWNHHPNETVAIDGWP